MDTKGGKLQWGGDGGVLNWVIGIDMCTMMCIKLMTDQKIIIKKIKCLSYWICEDKTVTCLLILLTLSFTEQKFLILMKSNLSSFSFKDLAFGAYLKTHCQTEGDLDFLLCYLLEVL